MKFIKMLLVSIIFLLPFKINALNSDFQIICPESANGGAEITCSVSSKITDITSMTASYEYSNLNFSKFSVSSGWKLGSSGTSSFFASFTGEKFSGGVVGTFSFKMPTSGTASLILKNISYKNSSDEDITISEQLNVSIRVKSSINTLDNLEISGAKINFNKSVTSYDVTINSDTTTISATKTNQYSKVTGTGSKKLDYGKNTFSITVESETGTKKVYTINVTRIDNRSTNNDLSSLKISSGTIAFNKVITTYNLNVTSDVEKIKIDATTEDKKASFVDKFGPREVKLNYGKNEILLKVKSEKQTEKVYTLNVTRKDDREGNIYLKSLTLSNGNISFDKEKFEYTVNVGLDVEKITINAIPEDDKSTVKYDSEVQLNEGNNTVEIEVASQNGLKQIYKLNIVKSDDSGLITSNNYLKELVVEGYTISFNKEMLSYSLNIKEETRLNITAIPENEKATVNISGNNDLKNGSRIIITVTAEDNTIKEYVINVSKDETAKETIKNKDNNLMVPVGIFAFGLIMFIISMIVKYKREHK